MESLHRKTATASLFFTVCLFGGTLVLLLSLSIVHSKTQEEEEGPYDTIGTTKTLIKLNTIMNG